MSESNSPILFFDGVCVLCNRMFQFVIRHDRQKRFRFATLQSGAGTVAKSMVSEAGTDSMILQYSGKYHTKADAALRVGILLGGIWRILASIALTVPRFVRNWVYDWVARNRYKWFGKKDACMIPDASVRERFVSDNQ